jgi:hypothetical protein
MVLRTSLLYAVVRGSRECAGIKSTRAQALQSGNPPYDRSQTTELVSYLRQLKQHYALESRWKASPFWRGCRMR